MKVCIMCSEVISDWYRYQLILNGEKSVLYQKWKYITETVLILVCIHFIPLVLLNNNIGINSEIWYTLTPAVRGCHHPLWCHEGYALAGSLRSSETTLLHNMLLTLLCYIGLLLSDQPDTDMYLTSMLCLSLTPAVALILALSPSRSEEGLSSMEIDAHFRYYFQHPWSRLIVAYLVTFFNFLIFAEDPVSHSQTEAHMIVVGNCFSFLFNKYPGLGWNILKVVCWTLAIITGLLAGKFIFHRQVFGKSCTQ